ENIFGPHPGRSPTTVVYEEVPHKRSTRVVFLKVHSGIQRRGPLACVKRMLHCWLCHLRLSVRSEQRAPVVLDVRRGFPDWVLDAAYADPIRGYVVDGEAFVTVILTGFDYLRVGKLDF